MTDGPRVFVDVRSIAGAVIAPCVDAKGWRYRGPLYDGDEWWKVAVEEAERYADLLDRAGFHVERGEGLTRGVPPEDEALREMDRRLDALEAREDDGG